MATATARKSRETLTVKKADPPIEVKVEQHEQQLQVERTKLQVNHQEEFSKLFSIIRPDDRFAVFVDFHGYELGIKSLNASGVVDLKKLHDMLNGLGRMVQPRYYCANTTGNPNLPKMLDFLELHGWQVVEGNTWKEQDRPRNDAVIRLLVDFMTAAYTLKVDKLIYIGSNGVMAPAIQRVQETGVRVTVVASTVVTEGYSCSKELRRACDNFVDLRDVIPLCLRPNIVYTPDPIEQRAAQSHYTNRPFTAAFGERVANGDDD